MAHYRVSGITVFSAVAIFCLVAGLLIQLLVLPVWLPQIHAGHGLLEGGDWIGYHAEGAALATRIATEGWSAWELRPRDNAAIGIVAAIYAGTGIHAPWIILPLNSLLFALGATCLYGIYMAVAPSNAALAGVFPYLLFPSAALQFAQITKDVWTMAGSLLICFSFVRLGDPAAPAPTAIIRYAAFAACGALLIWIVRPYHLELLLPGIAAMIGVLAIATLLGQRTSLAQRGIATAICLIAVLSLPLLTTAIRAGAIPGGTSDLVSDPVQDLIARVPAGQQIMPRWEPTGLPDFIESRLRIIGQYRETFIRVSPDARSFIDRDVTLDSLGDIIRYVPRAIQVGLLAPFPNMWFTSGANPGAGTMRAVAGLEMAASYLLLAGFVPLWLLSRGHRTQQTLMTIAFALGLLTVMAFIFPNVGTLYRLRYPYLQMLTGLGMIGWFLAWQARSGFIQRAS